MIGIRLTKISCKIVVGKGHRVGSLIKCISIIRVVGVDDVELGACLESIILILDFS